MRILQVRFKNLNSLTGEWCIDFTHPEYTGDGIFAITGPTGAGKTTILDAICLALYGQTPRLTKISKNGNEIMSCLSGECYAEVLFETRAGLFRCHWGQHRARKKAEGELQAPRHEIVDAVSGKVVENKIRDVAAKIEEVTGMDFDRFTRSMLLAQGGFAAFLQAPPDQRAPILEQITGTEIYSHISIRVHETRAEKRKQVELLQAGLIGIKLLSDEDIVELRAQMESAIKQAELSGLKVEELRKAFSWLEKLQSLKEELSAAELRWIDFESRSDEYQLFLKRLDKARKALSIEGDYLVVSSLREEQQKDIEALSANQELLEAKDELLAAVLKHRDEAEAQHEQARRKQQSESQVIKKVRELDLKLEAKKEPREGLIKRCVSKNNDREEALVQRHDKEANLRLNIMALRNSESYIAQNANDAALVNNLNAVKRIFAALKEDHNRRNSLRQAMENVCQSRDKISAVIAQIQSEHQQNLHERSEAEKDYQAQQEKMALLLRGRETVECYEELRRAKERHLLLQEARQSLQTIASAEEVLEDIKKNQKMWNDEIALLEEQIQSAGVQKNAIEREIEHLRKEATLLHRIRDMEGERKYLQDGSPCPLCGAVHHPYAEGNIPEINDTEEDLNRAGNDLKLAQEQLSQLQIRITEFKMNIKNSQSEIEEKNNLRETECQKTARILQELELTVDSTQELKIVREEQLNSQNIKDCEQTVMMLEQYSRAHEKFRSRLDEVRETANTSGKRLQEAEYQRGLAQREYERLLQDYQHLESSYLQKYTEAISEVNSFGIDDLDIEELDSVWNGLKQRMEKWQARQEEKSASEKKITELNADIRLLQATINQLEEDIPALNRELQDIMAEIEHLQTERVKLYGEKNPDEEEKACAAALDETEKCLQEAQQEFIRFDQEMVQLKEKINIIEESTRSRAAQLQQLEPLLAERLLRAGFADHDEYIASRLPEEEREKLEQLIENIRREKTEIQTALQDRRKALEQERKKSYTGASREELQAELSITQDLLQKTQQRIGVVRERLLDNEKQQHDLQERSRHLAVLKRELEKWDALHELIGSADGKKFRNYAQGLTFEMLIRHANRQLAAMTERYVLAADRSEALELNVIDAYQAGEVRSTRNLSGGESFLVSLSLALALSNMSSRNVPIDSLFLDEGFGTLDEEALDTALETLTGLQQDGKLIGVISHVPALKERIRTSIQVIPRSSGRSIIQGPGCSSGAPAACSEAGDDPDNLLF